MPAHLTVLAPGPPVVNVGVANGFTYSPEDGLAQGDFVAIFDIPAEIARGCPSTAWNVGNLATHHWMLGYWDPETQHEVWDANPDALMMNMPIASTNAWTQSL